MNFRIIIFRERRANRIKINEMHISVTKTIVEPKTLETPSKQNALNSNLALLDFVAFVTIVLYILGLKSDTYLLHGFRFFFFCFVFFYLKLHYEPYP